MEKFQEAIEKNLEWFKNSGVLEEEGRQGVHERVWLLRSDHPLVNGDGRYDDGIIKYRRVDCALETALAFEYGDELFPNRGYSEISENLRKFVRNTPFQITDHNHPEFGLYAHGLTFVGGFPQKFIDDKNPIVRHHEGKHYFWDKKWVDDNSWVVILTLGRLMRKKDQNIELSDEDKTDANKAFLTAEALIDKTEILRSYCRGQLDGVPHWGGMRVMALAFAYSASLDERFREAALKFLQPDIEKIDDFRKGKAKAPYDMSNCGYFSMIGSSLMHSIKNQDIENSVETVVDYLLKNQSDIGHWPGEWWEGSSGENVADLVYGQNWTTLGLQAYAQLRGDLRVEAAVRKSLDFLASIQNNSNFPKTNGAWLGSYDVKRKTWGGEDRKEGGPSCIYTGWTNAPIDLAFISEVTKKRNIIIPSHTREPSSNKPTLRDSLIDLSTEYSRRSTPY